MSEALEKAARAEVKQKPPTRWRNWFRVFPLADGCLTNNGIDISPGLHEDVNLFASKDGYCLSLK